MLSRLEAKKLGLTKYFTNKVCSKGHLSERYVSTHQCVECIRERKIFTTKKGISRVNNNDFWIGIRFKDADFNNFTFYDGKICNKCNNTKRYTNNSECVFCCSDRVNSGNRKEYLKEYNSKPTTIIKNKIRYENYLNKNRDIIRSNKIVYSNGFASYSHYKDMLTIEESPVSSADGYLIVKCANCSKYFKPKQMHVNKRVQCLKGNYRGESRLYCSENCKSNCSIYNKQGSYKDTKNYRPLQKEWKALAIEIKRKNSIDGKLYCEKCGAPESGGLIAHHIDPVINNPIESADIDNCLLLCNTCDKKVHKQPGCTLRELQC
jgi:hypothetical protein